MLRIVCAAALALGLSGPAGAADLVFGAVFNTSGSQTVVDDPSLAGARLAADQHNATDADTKVKLVVSEGDSVPQNWTGPIDAAIADHPQMLALFGLSDTDNVHYAATAAAGRNVAFLTTGATAPALIGEVPTYLYFVCFGDNVQAAAAAEWAHKTLGSRRAYILFDPNETYPVVLNNYFKASFEKLGGVVTAIQEVQPQQRNPVIPPIDEADIVFLSVETAEDAARMIPLIRKSGWRGPIVGGDGYDVPAVWADHPEVGDVYFSTHVDLGPDNKDPAVAAFVLAYKAANDGAAPTAFSALSYDGVGLLAAAAKAGGATREGILKGLKGITDYEGITGKISFADGPIPTKPVTIMKVEGGAQRFVAEVTPSAVPSP